jgi:hypothetical protein
MTGFESKRQAAQAKLDDDDAQVYIAEYEAALLVSYQSGFADGKKAAQPEQEPVAWRTFDGEGGYDYRTYDDNENYHDEWGKRNPNHKEWVEPVYTTPPAAQRPWVGLTDEDRRKFAAAQYGWEDLLIAAEAKLKERNRGATTHCQCAACKNGNIHDSDCSVHNGDALPVGPCDCSLATPPVQPAEPAQKFYQPAANEAVEILKSLGYVYEPTYTGLAWVAKKSAQPEQRKPLTDEQIQEVMTKAVQAKKVSWMGYEKDEFGRYTIPVLSPHHFQIFRIAEAAHNIKEGI